MRRYKLAPLAEDLNMRITCHAGRPIPKPLLRARTMHMCTGRTVGRAVLTTNFVVWNPCNEACLEATDAREISTFRLPLFRIALITLDLGRLHPLRPCALASQIR